MTKKKSLQIIILFGLVSLFGDFVYEGARSVNGPYLKTLGASAAVIGLFAGLGEFLGYAARFVSGYLSDRTKSYWLFVFAGYVLIISVPLLSIAATWQVAMVFIILERFGKALRSPARDTIVSMASSKVGTGVGFGITEVFDQIGAISGPLLLSGFLFFSNASPDKQVHDYQRGYSLFWVPFVLLLVCLWFAYRWAPNPADLEVADAHTKTQKGGHFSRLFWLYTAFTFVTTAGFANVILIGYHFKNEHLFADAVIPLLYSLAMAVDAVVAIVVGKTYDVLKMRYNNKVKGLSVLAVLPVLSVLIAVCAFSKTAVMAITGMALWGVVMGIHETVMRSAIADITPVARRGTAYGVFNAGYGMAIFIGSAVMGLLYDISLPVLVGAVVAVEAAAMLIFFAMRKAVSVGRV